MVNLSKVLPELVIPTPTWKQLSSTGDDVPLFPSHSIPSRLDPPESPIIIPECFK